MTTQRTIQILIACVVLLAGITLAQYFKLNQQTASTADLKAEILAELRNGSTHTLQRNKNTESTRTSQSATPKPRPKPLSETKYWISEDYSDTRPDGFTTLIEMVPDGTVILEHCFAPDYSVVEVTAEQDPYQIPTCEVLSKTRIVSISDSKMILTGNKSIAIKLAGTEEKQTLTLNLNNHKIELVPGQKNTLWEGLSSLKSIEAAHKAAWERHTQLRELLEVADKP